MVTTVHPQARSAGYITDFYLLGIARRLEIHGEPVKHIQPDGNAEWVKLQFHEPPENLGINGVEVEITTSNPSLSGRADWITVAPVKWTNRHHKLSSVGSKFVVRGITYQVRKAPINHRGGIRIDLVQDSCCKGIDPLWADELAGVLCSKEWVCL